MVAKKNTVQAGTFPTAQSGMGYDIAHVEEFLAKLKPAFENKDPETQTVTSSDIRNTSFKLKKNGYDPRYVDAALDRFEELFFAREKDIYLKTKGATIWKARVGEIFEALIGRLNRPAAKRFKTSTIFAHGYKKSQVDAALDQVKQALTAKAEIKPAQVRGLRFHAERNGYDEAQVDHFLDALVEYLLSVKK